MTRRVQENIVLCGLLLVFIAAIVACTGYGPRARVVPLPIATLGAILTLAQLVLQNWPSLGDLHLDAVDMFTSHAPGAGADRPAAKREGGASDPMRSRREVIAIGFVVLLTGMFWLIGPMPSIFLFTAGYLLMKRQFNWPIGLALAALFTAVVYVLFAVVLGVEFGGNSILGAMLGF